MSGNTIRSRKGMTLIEVIIALAIVGIVLAMIYGFFSFGSRSAAIGEKQYDLQFNVRSASDFITRELRYMKDVNLVNQSNMVNMINNTSLFSNSKKYIYVVPATGELYYSIGNTIRRKLCDAGTYTLSFEPRGSGKSVYYNIDGKYKERSFTVNSEVLVLNLSSSVVPGGTGPYIGIAYGPLSSSESVAVDAAGISISTVSGSHDLNNITENLVLTGGTTVNGSTITWASSDTSVIANNGTVTRPVSGVLAPVTLTATVTNGSDSLTRVFNVTVLPYATLQLNTGNPLDGKEQTVYTGHQFTATGGSGNYTFTISSGTLPKGLSLSSSGILSGKPSNKSANTYMFSIKVSDDAGHSCINTYTMKVTI